MSIQSNYKLSFDGWKLNLKSNAAWGKELSVQTTIVKTHFE